MLKSDIFALITSPPLGFRLRLYRLAFLVYFPSSFDLQLDYILLLRNIVISNLRKLHRLNLSRLIIQILQLLLQRLIVFLIKIQLIELCLLEFSVHILVEMVGLKQSPNQSNRKMSNNNRGDDRSTYNLRPNGLHDFNVVLVVKHCATDEGETDLVEDMNKVSQFVLVRTDNDEKNEHNR